MGDLAKANMARSGWERGALISVHIYWIELNRDGQRPWEAASRKTRGESGIDGKQDEITDQDHSPRWFL
jgi:hypothetical protein